ncbi:MAG: OB-fold nucleic acid binding domain-containing protein [Candidatus Njordarchaeia archaeon]
MSIDSFFNIDINSLKRKIAEMLNISLAELEEEIEKIKVESKGMAGDRTALLLLLDRWGVTDKNIFEDIVIGNSITPISELKENVRSVSILARIIRIYPKQRGKNNVIYKRVLIDDGTEKAFLTMFGDAIKEFEEKGFKTGDPILIRRVRVQKRIGNYLSMVAGNDVRLDKPDKERFGNILRTLPDPPIILSVTEIIETIELFDEGDEVNLVGIVDNMSPIREFTRKDGTRGRVTNITLADKDVPFRNVRVVVWDRLVDYVTKDIKVGDIIEVDGGRIKKTSLPSGENRIEIHLNKMSSILRLGEKTVKISDCRQLNEHKVVIYGYLIEDPNIKVFDRNGEETEYAVLRIIDDTSQIRVLVWNQDALEIVKSLKQGTPVRLYGRIKLQNDNVELHIPRNGAIELVHENFPIEKPFEELLKNVTVEISTVKTRTFDDFSNLMDEAFVDIVGKVEYLEIPEVERLPSIVIIGDKMGNRVKVIGWDREKFYKIREIGLGSTVKITSLKTDSDKISNEFILKMTQRTEIEKKEEKAESGPIEENIEFIDAKAMLEKREKSKKFVLLRELDKMSGESKVIGSIISIIDANRGSFCEICGAPMIKNQEVCENGHIAKGQREYYAYVAVDDGEESYEALIKESSLKEIGYENPEVDKKKFEDFLETILGLDYILTVRPMMKPDGSTYLLINKVEEVPVEEAVKEFYKTVNKTE